MSRNSNRLAFKICIFGDGGVGKTTLLNRYMTGLFTEGTLMTIGVDFKVKKLMVDEKVVTLQIWDFAGEDRFRFLLPAYVQGSSGAIFLFDTTRYNTLKNINEWSDVIDTCTDMNKRPLPVILGGSKVDLVEKRSVDPEYAKSLCENNQLFIEYIECSSKTGQNVEKLFDNLAREMLLRKNIV